MSKQETSELEMSRTKQFQLLEQSTQTETTESSAQDFSFESQTSKIGKSKLVIETMLKTEYPSRVEQEKAKEELIIDEPLEAAFTTEARIESEVTNKEPDNLNPVTKQCLDAELEINRNRNMEDILMELSICDTFPTTTTMKTKEDTIKETTTVACIGSKKPDGKEEKVASKASSNLTELTEVDTIDNLSKTTSSYVVAFTTTAASTASTATSTSTVGTEMNRIIFLETDDEGKVDVATNTFEEINFSNFSNDENAATVSTQTFPTIVVNSGKNNYRLSDVFLCEILNFWFKSLNFNILKVFSNSSLILFSKSFLFLLLFTRRRL